MILEAKQLVSNGAKEITLLGQNVNAYNSKGSKLSDLIFEISKIENLKRIRYTTSHPKDFSEDLINIHRDCKKLMPLVHLPVQSGSNKILEAMNRRHTVEEYLETVNKLKKINPLIKFSSDFIIGYPGETLNDFEQTKTLMKNVKFINSYSFIFSARPGTPAFNLKEIDKSEAKKRLIIFQKIAEQIKTKYRETLINKLSNVLFENKIKNEDKYFGRDEYSNSVIVKSNKNLIGEIQKVEINNGNHSTLYGKIVRELSQSNHAA